MEPDLGWTCCAIQLPQQLQLTRAVESFGTELADREDYVWRGAGGKSLIVLAHFTRTYLACDTPVKVSAKNAK
jgi:hypothetical protein